MVKEDFASKGNRAEFFQKRTAFEIYPADKICVGTDFSRISEKKDKINMRFFYSLLMLGNEAVALCGRAKGPQRAILTVIEPYLW